MTVAPLFAEAARTHAHVRPDDIAVLDGALRWSWAELDRRASDVASRLEAAGLAPGDRVGLVAESSAGVVAALHAMVRAGLVAVVIGPRLTRPEVAAIEAAAGLRAIAAPNGDATSIEVPRRAARPPEPPSGVPAVIVPTSGTTGRPKLVRLGAAQLDASAAGWSAVLPPATGWLLSLNIAHVSGIGIVVRAARAGVPVVVPVVPETSDADPIEAGIRAARSAGIRVSHASLVAPQLVRLLDRGDAATPRGDLRAIILGGGPIPESLVARALASGWPIVPSYGLSETASGVVAVPLGDAQARPWSAGRAMPGVEIRIENPAQPGGGGPGEILVRGPMVFDGYENDAEASAAALDAQGWLHTGDLGTLDPQGWLRVVARRDEIIISGGENVAPAEIEAALASHQDVADAGVFGVADAKWGAVPVAVVAFRPGRSVAAEALLAFARQRLASFKVPARIVVVDAVPRSEVGKLLRRSLPALVVGSVPTPGLRPSAAGLMTIEADDGRHLGVRDLPGPAGSPTVVFLHATLSTSGQLLRLARRLNPYARVVLMDRRGSGFSAMETAAPVQVHRHVEDILAVLDAAGADRPLIFGHSFGALLAVEFAARHAERAAAVVAYEPPYLAVASPSVATRFGSIGHAVAAAHAAGGPAAAARLFVRSVAGDAAWEGLGPDQRAQLEAEGSGALADTSMADLDPAGLARIVCPLVLATGGASDAFYAEIADSLAAAIPGSRRVVLPGLRHTAPITDTAPIAELIREALAALS